jgi:hypothetical protein
MENKITVGGSVKMSHNYNTIESSIYFEVPVDDYSDEKIKEIQDKINNLIKKDLVNKINIMHETKSVMSAPSKDNVDIDNIFSAE